MEGLRLETGINGGGAGEKRPSQDCAPPENKDRFVRGVEPPGDRTQHHGYQYRVKLEVLNSGPGVFIPFIPLRYLLAFWAKDSAVQGATRPGVTKLVIGKKRPGGGVKPPEGPVNDGV